MKKSRIVSTLRRLWLKSPARNKVKKSARVERGKYQCNHCKQIVGNKQIQIHHIKPVVSNDGFTTWDDFIDNLFCGEDGLEAVCVDCHDKIHKK